MHRWAFCMWVDVSKGGGDKKLAEWGSGGGLVQVDGHLSGPRGKVAEVARMGVPGKQVSSHGCSPVSVQKWVSGWRWSAGCLHPTNKPHFIQQGAPTQTDSLTYTHTHWWASTRSLFGPSPSHTLSLIPSDSLSQSLAEWLNKLQRADHKPWKLDHCKIQMAVVVLLVLCWVFLSVSLGVYVSLSLTLFLSFFHRLILLR